MLIHEGVFGEAGLSETKIIGKDIIQTLVVGKNMQLPDHWVINLLNAIRWTPENHDEF
jgi:hypothetical protein